jgi:hypothetical protein
VMERVRRHATIPRGNRRDKAPIPRSIEWQSEVQVTWAVRCG